MAVARSNRNALSSEAAVISATTGDGLAVAMLEGLREALAHAGVHESRSPGQEGVFFVVEGRDEVSLHYVEAERPEFVQGRPPSLRARSDMLKCYSALADGKYALTLVSSLRTLTLHVRYEAGSEPVR